MVAGIVQARSIDRIHASTNPLSSGYNVIKEGITQEEFAASAGEVIGILSIPRLNTELPIIEGEEGAVRGVSHKISSSYPNENGSIFLKLLESTVVKRLSEIQIGDEIVMNLPYGSFTYLIKQNYSITNTHCETECIILTTPDETITFFAEKVKAT